ncbi:MAG: hypothetical protein KGY60_06355 [Bacteroidales bacterium]|nr:hypothetical protein [Bacteroidales bacterium]
MRSANRIFFRSSNNQDLPLIVQPDFAPLPEKLMQIIEKKGLVNWIRSQA